MSDEDDTEPADDETGAETNESEDADTDPDSDSPDTGGGDGDGSPGRTPREDATESTWTGEATPFVWNTTDESAGEHSVDAEPTEGDPLDGDTPDEGAVDDTPDDGAVDGTPDEGAVDGTPDDGAVGEGAAMLTPDRYLLAGESVVDRLDVGRGWVAATTHRVLVFDPTSDGRRFAAVDRPNVVGVRTTHGGDPTVLTFLSRAVVSCVLLLGAGVAARSLGFESLFVLDTGVADTPGVGGLVSMLSLAGTLLGLFVDALFVGGVVAGLAAFVLAGWYLHGREPTLVVERAGDDDLSVRLPSRETGDRAVERLERLLADELAVGS
jgi:hypothetical protein